MTMHPFRNMADDLLSFMTHMDVHRPIDPLLFRESQFRYSQSLEILNSVRTKIRLVEEMRRSRQG